MAVSAWGDGHLLGTPPGLPWQKLDSLTPELDVGENSPRSDETYGKPDGEAAARWARKMLDRETPRAEQFRTEARKAFAFVAGDQVSGADRSMMEGAGRPIIELNDTQRFLRIISGIERRVPLAVFYVPRNPSDVQAGMKGELATQAKEWAYDKCEAPHELNRAKNDRNITGMGWTETFISRSEDPAGLIQIQRFSPMEAIWPQSSRENLKGSRWRARERQMPIDVAIQKWPQAAMILSAGDGGGGAPKDYPVKADLVKYVVPWTMTEPTN